MLHGKTWVLLTVTSLMCAACGGASDRPPAWASLPSSVQAQGAASGAGPRLASFVSSGPINATPGQVISGLRISNPNGPCITVNGASGVHIVDSELGPCAGEAAIEVNNTSDLTIEYNYMHDNRAGVYALGGGSNINISHNYFKNAVGGLPRGQYVQFNGVRGSNNKLTCNVGEQAPFNQGNAKEDSFSMYDSGGSSTADPIEIAYNKIRGGSSPTGCGFMNGEEHGSYIHVHHNNVVHPGVCGIAVAGGHDIILSENKIYSDEGAGPGMYVWEWTNTNQACFNHTVRNNLVNWVGGNNFWNAGNCTNVSVEGNTFGANIGPEIWDEEFPQCGTTTSALTARPN